MRGVVILLCLLLAGCRGKRVVTEMTDTTKVRLDSVVVSTMKTERYKQAESCEAWAGIDFCDSGGFVLMENGRLAAKGVKRLRWGESSSAGLSLSTTAGTDSAAVRKTEDKGVAGHEETRVRERKSGGWWGYCLVFVGLLVGVMWCLRRRLGKREIANTHKNTSICVKKKKPSS